MKRACDGCTACCTVMDVEDIKKPSGVKCAHCVTGQGCSIYDVRPEACKIFYCLWLEEDEIADGRPDQIGVVYDYVPPVSGTPEAFIFWEVWEGAFASTVFQKAVRLVQEKETNVLLVYAFGVRVLITPDGSSLLESENEIVGVAQVVSASNFLKQLC
jgi:Fe-S-cluster containining protein